MLGLVVELNVVIVVSIVLVSVVMVGEVARLARVLKTVVGTIGVAFGVIVVDNNKTGVLFGGMREDNSDKKEDNKSASVTLVEEC